MSDLSAEDLAELRETAVTASERSNGLGPWPAVLRALDHIERQARRIEELEEAGAKARRAIHHCASSHDSCGCGAAFADDFWCSVIRISDEQRTIPRELRSMAGVPAQEFDVSRLPGRLPPREADEIASARAERIADLEDGNVTYHRLLCRAVDLPESVAPGDILQAIDDLRDEITELKINHEQHCGYRRGAAEIANELDELADSRDAHHVAGWLDGIVKRLRGLRG